LIVINKSDLQQRLDLERVDVVRAKDCLANACTVPVCAKDGTGVDVLKANLRQVLLGSSIESSLILNNLRHKNSLSRGDQVLGMALDALTRGDPPELIAINLHEARESFEEVVGMVTSDDVLERIFSDFCIGK
jgi:tRNA modification GTPase